MFSIGALDRMNAEEIRRRAELARERKPEIEGLVRRVFDAIEEAAMRGEMQITRNPIEGLRMQVTPEMAKRVWKRVRARGFTVKLGKKFSVSW